MAESTHILPGYVDPEEDLNELDGQLDQYEKGRKLRKFVQDPDWELVVQVLRDYYENANDALNDLPPGHPRVMEAHAASSATKQVYVRFQEDINSAVNFANNPPEELKNRIFGIRKSLDVASAMGA